MCEYMGRCAGRAAVVDIWATSFVFESISISAGGGVIAVGRAVAVMLLNGRLGRPVVVVIVVGVGVGRV